MIYNAMRYPVEDRGCPRDRVKCELARCEVNDRPIIAERYCVGLYLFSLDQITPGAEIWIPGSIYLFQHGSMLKSQGSQMTESGFLNLGTPAPICRPSPLSSPSSSNCNRKLEPQS